MMTLASDPTARSTFVPTQVTAPERLAALKDVALLDMSAEPAFDRLTHLAATILHTPVALISLVDADRQCFKSGIGLSEPWASLRQIPLSYSFCQHTVALGAPLSIEDARQHPLVCQNPAVREMGVIAYLGVPLTTTDGHTLGALCVVDTQPRAWTARDVTVLEDLAAATMTEITLRSEARDRRAAEAALQRSQQHMEQVLERITDAFFALDRQGCFTYLNQHAAHLFQRPRADLLGACIWELFPDAVQSPFLTHYHTAITTQSAVTFEAVYPPLNLWIEVHAYPSHDGLSVYFHDIATRKQAEAALQTSEARHRAILDTALDAIITIDHAGRVIEFNAAAEQMFGYRHADVVGHALEDLIIPPALRAAHRRGMAHYLATGNGPVLNKHIEVTALRADGSEFPVELTIRRIGSEEPPLFTGSLRDITERKAFEAQLHHRAVHDALTGLPNRTLFMDRLDHALARRARTTQPLAVLFLDLDRFKVVNDSLGHALGDQLLCAVAQRLRTCVRMGDTVARWGGDEFTILLDDHADAQQVAARVLEALTPAFVLGDRSIFTSASIGIACSTAAHTRADELLREADVAMYQAKAKGKAQYQWFDARWTTGAVDQLDLEADLRHALERGEFEVVYQPKVMLASERLTGFEALLRWHHPQRGSVSPAQFIPLAEEMGLIVPIGQWIFAQACRQAQVWQRSTGNGQDITMHVNLSARQFQHPHLVADVAQVLQQTGLAPSQIVLEITESVVMEDAANNIATLRALKGLGVQLAIDDFGTGYSSLSYLRRFPVDILKINKTFVDGLGQDPEATAIVEAIITLAHSLDLTVVAEGIETASQAQQLHALGCEAGQGYYFAKPLPAAAASAVLLHATSNHASLR